MEAGEGGAAARARARGGGEVRLRRGAEVRPHGAPTTHRDPRRTAHGDSEVVGEGRRARAETRRVRWCGRGALGARRDDDTHLGVGEGRVGGESVDTQARGKFPPPVTLKSLIVPRVGGPSSPGSGRFHPALGLDVGCGMVGWYDWMLGQWFTGGAPSGGVRLGELATARLRGRRWAVALAPVTAQGHTHALSHRGDLS